VTTLLPALVGLATAREMLMLGERYDAETLHRLGVAWRVVDDDRLMDEAYAVATRLAALPPTSLRAMKRTLNCCASGDLERALNLETEATVAGFLDPETTRLLKSF
jgi:enoyl-CoA hydratase/carnithine racemase